MIKIYQALISLFLLLLSFCASAQTTIPFITLWKGASTISLGVYGNLTYQLYQNNVPSTIHSSHSRTVASPDSIVITNLNTLDTYELRIMYTGTTASFRYPSSNLIAVSQWGNTAWTSMQHAFKGAYNLNNIDADSPTLYKVENFGYMFDSALVFNQPINHWNVSNGTLFQYMFRNAKAFNQPLSSWDVSKGTTFQYMFSGASSFNQNINSWTVSNSTSFEHTFSGATAFNQPLNSWNVSNSTRFHSTFSGATSFNQPLNSWIVSKGTTFISMFNGASSFNQDISSWDVSKSTNFSYMFQNAIMFNQPIEAWTVSNGTTFAFMFNGATSFNRPIGGWDVSKSTTFTQMFKGATTFNQDISGWNVSNCTNFSYMFAEAVAFNQPIGVWNVSKGELFNQMFFGAIAFNRPLNNWNVSLGKTFGNMFNGATNFNQNLGNWKLNSIVDTLNTTAGLNSIFAASGIDCYNLGSTLKGWSENTNIKTNLTFSIPSGYKYSPDGTIGKNTLISTYGWTFNGINSNTEDPNCVITPSIAPMITQWSGATTINPILAGVTHYRLYKNGVPVDYLRNIATYPFPITLPNSTENFELYLYYDNDFPIRTFQAPVPSLKKVINWGEVEWTSMENMFYNASGLTELPVDTPTTYAVQNFSSMFENAAIFNQPLIGWNVSNGTTFTNMFNGATAFNHTLHTWNISTSAPLSDYMLGSGINCDTLTATLSQWASNPNSPSNITLDLSTKNYSEIGTTAINDLINNKNWTITLGSELLNCIGDPLPIKLIKFNAALTEQNLINITWEVAEEGQVAHYTLEKMIQNQWINIGKYTPKHSNEIIKKYIALDSQPTLDNNIYRLKVTDLDGSNSYSKIVLVKYIHKNSIQLYPNPANRIITIKLEDSIKSINLYNTHGQLYLPLQLNTPSNEHTIEIDHLPNGIYFLHIKSSSGNIYREKFIKE